MTTTSRQRAEAVVARRRANWKGTLNLPALRNARIIDFLLSRNLVDSAAERLIRLKRNRS